MKDTISMTVVLDANAMGALPTEPFDGIEGVANTTLWHDAGSLAGILAIDAGRHLGLHAHRRNHHHLWVHEGSARILGQLLGPGSYVHVPAGVEHDIEAVGTTGCRVFYLYEQSAA